MSFVRYAVLVLAALSLAACVTPRYATSLPPGAQPHASAGATVGQGGTKIGQPYQVNGIWYVPKEQPDYDEVGVASWYGDAFHLKATANGEIFDMDAVSAAHTTLPLPSMVEVTNLENGRKLTVRVNDRGPFVGNRIIDLSREAARELGYERNGVTKVRVRYLGPAPLLGRDAGVRVARATPPAMPPAMPPPLAPRVVDAVPTGIVEVASLPPPTAVSAAPLPPVAGAPASTAGAATLRIQAGAFASEENAVKAVSRLAVAGRAVIVPTPLDDGTLYRVYLPAPADEVEAYALRDRVAEIGFTDARVVHAF